MTARRRRLRHFEEPSENARVQNFDRNSACARELILRNSHRLHLDPERILETAEKLARRVEDRFPGSSIARLSFDLSKVARVTVVQVERARRPIVWLRIAAWLLISLGIMLAIEITKHLHTNFDLGNPGDFIQSFQAALETCVLMGASILFVLGWENRIKRRRTLHYLHELRAIAHLVDIHQINKTPDTVRFDMDPTPNSPVRTMTPFQMARYFGYCAEMLSLVGKLATLYAQDFADPAVMQAVDQVEDLTTSLSSKIWQKSMLITHRLPAESPGYSSSGESSGPVAP